MIYDQQAARVKIDALLELPRILAGASSLVLDIALLGLSHFIPQESEFGPLLADAGMALGTVNSALLILRQAAVEREQMP